MMTIDEKQKAIEAFCKCHNCAECPIANSKYRCALVRVEDPDIVCNQYDILFPAGQPTTSAVDHPGHYNREGAMECIDEMLLIFGKEAVMGFCLCNAWKYRYRAADKNGLEDLKKSDWYLAKYKELMGVNEIPHTYHDNSHLNCRCVLHPVMGDGEC